MAKLKEPLSSGTKRVQMDLPPKSVERLKRLQELTEAASYAELTDGRVYSNRYHFLFQLAGGKVLHVKEYMDTHHAFEIFLPSS